MKVTEVRNRFVDYYKARGFYLLPRAPMLHPSIPMSFVMSAGLVQVETSRLQTQAQVGNRVVLVQRCFRHFDLDRVGTDNIHLSLFEMPGAFVLDGRNKRETIKHMRILATRALGINQNSLWVTYFAGGKLKNTWLPKDNTTYEAWLENGIPADRIVGLGAEHNYWLQKESSTNEDNIRKSGPNTELFFDRGRHLACGPHCLPACRCRRFIEFANSLFITNEFDTHSQSFAPMKDPFYETVIGTERVAMILQGAPSVFDTECFLPLMRTIRQYLKCADLPPETVEANVGVIADHARALCALVAEGAPPPGKNGRARIIKLLIRRIAARKLVLGIRADDFLPALLQAAAATFEDGEVTISHTGKLERYFVKEAERFHTTVERARCRLATYLSQNSGRTLSGSQILKLEKQCGLPHVLTAMELRKRGLIFRSDDYHRALRAWNQAPAGLALISGRGD